MHLELIPYGESHRESCMAVFESNLPKYFREHERSGFAECLDGNAYPYFVVVHDGQVIGCGGYGVREGSRTADLCWGMINAQWHGQHAGEFLLLSRVARIVEGEDVDAIRVGTSQLTDGFFERFGFAVQWHRPGAIDEGLDDVEMRIELTDEVRTQFLSRWEDWMARGRNPE